jgi:signal transduction histidine kinase
MTLLIKGSEQTRSISAVASIVHDLRNPLATIHGSAEMLVASRLSPAQIQRIARNMYRASARMRELLDEFFDQSRSAERQMEPSDVRELVRSAVNRVAVSAESQSVQIVQAVPEGLTIAVNRHPIHRVLVNLLVNALEAMLDGGTIRISAVSACGWVFIEVRDTGPGIAPEIRDRLFEPFVTAGKADGLGLGLASSRQTVIDHGGEIWVESSSQGACFTLRLPSTMPQSGTVPC